MYSMAQENSGLSTLKESDDMSIVDYGYLHQIYNNINGYVNNPIGTVALMANLYAESSCCPNRLQGDVYGAPTSISINYTNAVDDLSYSKEQFVSDSKGYGLAQWTIRARKTLYYDYAPINSIGIGSITRALGYLHAELRGDYASQGLDYRSTLTACQNAIDLHTCTDYVLDHFEGPAEPNYSEREQIADDLWEFFFGTTTGYNIYTYADGNGTITAVPSSGLQRGDTYTLTCTPASGESLLDIIAVEIPSGISVAIEVVTGSQTVRFNSDSNISITAYFTGTPPTPPTGTVKRHRMPIWMYPALRRRV